jgi:hypothetical protein
VTSLLQEEACQIFLMYFGGISASQNQIGGDIQLADGRPSWSITAWKRKNNAQYPKPFGHSQMLVRRCGLQI